MLNQPRNFWSPSRKKRLKKTLLGLGGAATVFLSQPAQGKEKNPLDYYGVDTSPKTEYYDARVTAIPRQFQEILDNMPYLSYSLQSFEAKYGRTPASQTDFKEVFYNQILKAGVDAGTHNESSAFKADQISLTMSQEFMQNYPANKEFEQLTKVEFLDSLRAVSNKMESIPASQELGFIMQEKLDNLKPLRAPEIKPEIENQNPKQGESFSDRYHNWLSSFKKWLIPLAAVVATGVISYNSRKKIDALMIADQVKTQKQARKLEKPTIQEVEMIEDYWTGETVTIDEAMGFAGQKLPDSFVHNLHNKPKPQLKPSIDTPQPLLPPAKDLHVDPEVVALEQPHTVVPPAPEGAFSFLDRLYEQQKLIKKDISSESLDKEV
jgi:hypothetical protein